MKNQLLHIFRNSPMGRENLMQSAWFCEKQFGLSLAVFVPQATEFLLEFDGGTVPVDLDGSYLAFPETAREHVEEILARFNVQFHFHTPEVYGDGKTPILPGGWAMLACPRVISEQSGRIGLGHIGPRVRGIVKEATCPVFIPATAFKAWTSVAIFFGGSRLGALAVAQGIALARLARVPFTVYTQLDGTTPEACEDVLEEAGLLADVKAGSERWQIFSAGTLEQNLYEIPHDSLVVMGAAGHRLMAELIFGSKLEIIQTTLPNPLVVVGPECRITL